MLSTGSPPTYSEFFVCAELAEPPLANVPVDDVDRFIIIVDVAVVGELIELGSKVGRPESGVGWNAGESFAHLGEVGFETSGSAGP